MQANRYPCDRIRSAWLLLWWPVCLGLYWFTEQWTPPQGFHLIHCALDDRIPFLEGFAVFYVGWYLLIALSLGYFLLRDLPVFRQLQVQIILIQLLATAIFIIYPSCQELRPEIFPRENMLTDMMGLIYRLDTNTGVFPSLHAAISIAIADAWLRTKRARGWLKAGVMVFSLGVCLSVCFVKQHSVLDVWGAVPVCVLSRWLVSRI